MRIRFLLSLACTVLAISHKHKCTMEDHQKPLEPPPPLPEGRSLQDYRDTVYQPIRIHIEYVDLDVSSEYDDMIRNNIIAGTIAWYQNVLSIKRIRGNLTMGLTECEGITVPPAHQTTGVAADVIIYVTAGEENVASVGWAVVCALTPDLYPAAGRLHLESAAFEAQSYEDILATSIHEVAHILAFNPSLYHYFLTQPVTDSYPNRGKQVAGIITPTVVERARIAFGCAGMNGLELESQGGLGTSGAHWEKRVMHNDFMTADADIQDIVYSDLTMALFQDSGWYEVDYTYTTGVVWGKDQGCTFLQEKCIDENQVPKFSEYCVLDDDTERCDFMHLHKGFCNLDDDIEDIPLEYQYFGDDETGGKDVNIDYCPIIKQRSGGNCRGHDLVKTEFEGDNYEEEACENCRCVEGTFSNDDDPYDHAACVRVLTCNLDSVDLQIDGNIVNCPFDGGDRTIPGYDGVLHCPSTNILCQNMPCMNHCSGQGVCQNGVCQCSNGSTDPDCGGGEIFDEEFSVMALACVMALVI